MPEYQQAVNGTTSTLKLNTLSQNIQTEKLFQRLEVDSILGGKNSSTYWNELTQEMSTSLSLPTLTDSLGSDLNWLSGYAVRQDVNSWFSLKANSVLKPSLFKICCQSSTVSLVGYMDLENTGTKSKKTYKSNTRHSHSKKKSTKKPPNSVLKIKLYPSKELHRVWKRWLAAYRFYYNQSIAILLRDYDKVTKTIIDKKTGKSKEVKITGDDLDKILQKLESIPDWVKTLPGHQRQEACSEAYDAFKQARSQGGNPKFKSCKATSQTIQFKVGNFKKGTWYCNTTKGLNFSSLQKVPYQCEYGTELVYKRGEWFGCFPRALEEVLTGSDRVIALDPGNRTFLTGYDGENVLEIGKGDIGLIQRLCLHLDQLISKAERSQSRQKYQIRKAIKRARARIQNLIKDLHNKTVNLLVNSYKVIFLPTFDSIQMVCKINGKGKKRKINSKSARQMLTLSHYKFEQHLKQAAQRKGVIVVLCNESYTSKSCGACGHIYEIGSSKTHNCPNCGTKTSRDVNGARNIMLRSLASVKFSVSDNSIILSDAPQGIVGSDQERHVENVLL